MSEPWEIYDLLISRAQSDALETTIEQVTIGLTWTLCQTGSSRGNNTGLSMSPGRYTRTLPWPGTLTRKPVIDIISWLKSWDPFEAAIGLAATNSIINQNAPVSEQAVTVSPGAAPNLAVFEHFLPKLRNKKVVVVGRYPGLEALQEKLDLTVLERDPVAGDYPDPACEYLLPEADWVFLTANSIANKTFPRLAELSRNAVTVLMGPSVPWLMEWQEYGIDFLAGVRIADPDLLQATVAEGGGVRIFDRAVQYHVLDLSAHDIQHLKTNIADLVAQREHLKTEMDEWYALTSGNKRSRFPKWALLEQTDRELSLLDLRFKRQWDARYST